MRVAVLVASCLVALPAAAEPLRAPRVGGGMVEARFQPSPLNRPVAVALLVQDGCVRMQPSFPAPRGVVPVEMSLPCRAGGPDLRNGVLDVLTLVSRLRTSAPWWDRRLYLLGAGDGAEVAAAAAGLTPEVKGVVLIDGDATAADARPETPVLLIRTGAGGGAGKRPKVFNPAQVAYRELAHPAAALGEASRWLERREAPKAAAQPAPQPTRRAEKSPAPSAPRKTAKAGAPRRPAKAAKIQLAPARVAPKAAPKLRGLREALPATPDRRPGTGPAGPR